MSRTAIKCLALVGVMAIFGCAARSTVTVNTNVSEAELAPFRKAGTSSIIGQGFLRQNGGGVVTCAGSTVILSPDLPPIRQAIDAARAGHNVQGTGGVWGNAGRKATCDAQGNFHFDNLPSADWYVVTEVKWSVGYSPQGGTLGAPVSTHDGAASQVLLADANYIAW
jgi:hypothetical protein